MEFALLSSSILQAMFMSLGVGASTLAIVNFFGAIADGVISQDERNFMGVTYTVLRVAMVTIFITAVANGLLGYALYGTTFFTSYVAAQAILIAVLFTNAYLMTVHIMPSTFGPAIQASSWYSLSFLLTFTHFTGKEINFLVFIFAYLTLIFFGISFVNSIMAWLKERQKTA